MRHGALSKCGGAFAQQLELFQGGRTRRCPTALALERSPVDDRGTCEKGGRLVQVQEPELLADRPLVQGVPQEDRSGRSKRMIFLAVEPLLSVAAKVVDQEGKEGMAGWSDHERWVDLLRVTLNAQPKDAVLERPVALSRRSKSARNAKLGKPGLQWHILKRSHDHPVQVHIHTWIQAAVAQQYQCMRR
eukprot:4372722-Prymnesium_polylepis.1